jgi:lipoic acid synthetase
MTQIKTKKPDWLKVRAPGGEQFTKLKNMMNDLNLATVCQEAKCPNIGECWSGGTATIMLMGDTCTRGCKFCHVKTGNPRGALDPTEPEKVAYSIGQMGEDIHYIVLTSVDRDDLPDQGAGHFARTVRTVKAQNPGVIVEILTPDFRGDVECIKEVVSSNPDVFAHNVETVERLQSKVRDHRAGYQQSMSVLATVKKVNPNIYTKTSLMLGLGETSEEILATLTDLRKIDCDVVTFGQYLQPTPKHLAVERFYTPEEFAHWQKVAEDMGFLYVASGPLVRSSYRAGEFFMKGVIEKRKKELSHADSEVTRVR